jgi:hypothetical protein
MTASQKYTYYISKKELQFNEANMPYMNVNMDCTTSKIITTSNSFCYDIATNNIIGEVSNTVTIISSLVSNTVTYHQGYSSVNIFNQLLVPSILNGCVIIENSSDSICQNITYSTDIFGRKVIQTLLGGDDDKITYQLEVFLNQ